MQAGELGCPQENRTGTNAKHRQMSHSSQLQAPLALHMYGRGGKMHEEGAAPTVLQALGNA